MKNVIVYTSAFCPYCVRAKQLLSSLDIPFKEQDLSVDPELTASLVEKHNWKTVPMIFIGEDFVGGYDDLYKLHTSGELTSKLS
ncbi:glutaredoxin [Candidatus Uhrbacteria bacterium]|jgi:glutaredoxin 3|nr:glutaredoxin [Candidatus Uhrbacteria bacterium]